MYTLDEIHALTDDRLCEAISGAREPKPQTMSMYAYSEKRNWICNLQSLAIEEYSFEWVPVHWLLPENWTRLLEELANVKLRRFGIGNDWWFSANKEDVEICSTSPARSVCEAWLYLNQEAGK
jgi:hypothetical protein